MNMKKLSMSFLLMSSVFLVSTEAGASSDTQAVCSGAVPSTISSKVDGRHVILSARNASKTLKPARYKLSWTPGAGVSTETTVVQATSSGDAPPVIAAWAAILGSKAGSPVTLSYDVQAEFVCGKTRVWSKTSFGSRAVLPVSPPVIKSVSQSHTGEIVFNMGNTPASGFVSIASGCCVISISPVADTVKIGKPKSKVKLTFFSYTSTEDGASLDSNKVTIVTR